MEIRASEDNEKAKRTPKIKAPASFTGVAKSLEAYSHNGYRNFRIVNMKIEKGVVTEISYSDPFANFEAISKLETEILIGALNLNDNWEPGKALTK